MLSSSSWGPALGEFQSVGRRRARQSSRGQPPGTHGQLQLGADDCWLELEAPSLPLETEGREGRRGPGGAAAPCLPPPSRPSFTVKDLLMQPLGICAQSTQAIWTVEKMA